MRWITLALILLLIQPALGQTFGGFYGRGIVITPYEGNASTRAFMPTGRDPATTQTMSRSGHFARDTITALKIAAPNFETGGTVPGISATVKASVEYPEGTCTPFTFSGMATGTILDNSYLFSDYLAKLIPKDSKFWIRQFWQGANGTLSTANRNDNANMGDAFRTAASGLSDQTVDCTAITTAASGLMFFPAAIVSMTTRPSVCTIGDSLVEGVGDSYSNSSGDIGILDRSIGSAFGYIDSSRSGETAEHFKLSPQQAVIDLAHYCSHVVSNFGSNDIYVLGHSAATLKSDLTTVYALFTTQTIFQTTLTPRTTSTDGWATTVNQTVVTGEAARAAFNTDLLSSAFGPNGGHFDVAGVVEVATKWKAGGACSPWTVDGTHGSNCGYLQSSGAIDTSRIVYQ